MNLNIIRPKIETEDLLLSITKNCETLIQQTHTKPQETLEIKAVKPRETFHFKPPIQIKGDWMIGLTDLEVYNSIHNITPENNKFDVYKFPVEKFGVAYEKLRDEIVKDLDISDITDADLQDDIIAPIIIEKYKELVSKRMNDEQYMSILLSYSGSVFQDFESFLRTQIDLVENDIKLVLDEYNPSFFTYELNPGIYTFKDISKALFNIVQHNNEIAIKYDDITLKTRLSLGIGILAIRFDEKSFLVPSLVLLRDGIINTIGCILAKKF